MLKKIWSDPVWSKVIATGIIAAVAAVVTYFAGWWPDVAHTVSRIGTFAVAETPVHNWLLALLTLCAILVVVVLAAVGWALLAPSKEAPSFRDYVDDKFFDIRWRWRYGANGAIHNLVSFCPRCDYQIGPQRTSAYNIVDRIEYRCDDCGIRLAEFEIPVEEIESRVTRKIQKNIRAGKWNRLDRM